MNHTTEKSRYLWLAAFVSMALGLGLTLHNLSSYGNYTKRAKEYTDYLSQLGTLELEAARHEAIRQQFSIMAGKSPKPLREIADKAGVAASVNIREQPKRPLETGLNVHSVTVSADNMPYDQVSRLLQLAEISHPPWRLVSCRLKASPSSATAGQVDFVFEALDAGSLLR